MLHQSGPRPEIEAQQCRESRIEFAKNIMPLVSKHKPFGTSMYVYNVMYCMLCIAAQVYASSTEMFEHAFSTCHFFGVVMQWRFLSITHVHHHVSIHLVDQ